MVARLRLAIYAPCPFWPSRGLRLGDVGSARDERMGSAAVMQLVVGDQQNPGSPFYFKLADVLEVATL